MEYKYQILSLILNFTILSIIFSDTSLESQINTNQIISISDIGNFGFKQKKEVPSSKFISPPGIFCRKKYNLKFHRRLEKSFPD